MGASNSTGGGTSPGESKARVGSLEITGSKNAQKAQSKVIGKRADDYARKKLGITDPNVMNTPAGTLVTKGYTSSTVSNQMYGSEYQAARGEYLASQGLATARTVTDARGQVSTTYDPGVQTDKGFLYTNTSRGAMEAAKREPIPLSKEMFESQQRFKGGVGLATMIMGVPLIPSILLNQSRVPYSDYITQPKEKGFYNFSSSLGLQNFKKTNERNQYDENNNTNTASGDEFADATEAEKRRKKLLAGGGQSVSSKERSLFGSSPQTFSV